jgi:molybdopterin synthase sulfur carrier subunit
MVEIEFLGPIGMDSLELNVKNLEELSESLKKFDELKEWLENSAVAINDEIVSDKRVALKSGDRVSLLPPVCGG